MAIKLPPRCSRALARHLRPELFKALCDPRRLALLAQLAISERPLTVGEISSCCSIHLSGVSRHLAMLREASVLTAHKNGREVSYELNRGALVQALRGLADAIEDCNPAT
ncbi:MAG: metalloregulator ArsR/SmtB family transcription factor [Myxococcota bacterium]